MKIQIKNRWNDAVIFECEAETIREACEKAAKSGADLYGANLSGANLSGADLSGANLSGANLYWADLYGADLSRANLSGANLYWANLSGADLSRANLSGANLYWADLSGANLSGADLSRANLSGANLYGANLSGADLEPIRVDFFDVLLRARSNGEVQGLIDALKAGKVNGSTYTGECACLVGTIANYKGCNYKAIPNLNPNSERPAERFFLAIRKGDTPETNAAAKIAVEWAEEFLALTAHYGKAATV